MFSNLFEGRKNIIITRRPYHWKAISSNVGCKRFGVERIPNLQHSMLLHLVPSTKVIYGVLEFEVGCLGLHALRYYCRLEYAYQKYYHQHQIVVSNKPTFAITQMETISDHVVNQAFVEPEWWKQLMDYCQELVYLTNLGNRAMEAITWKMNWEFTKFQVAYAHLGQGALYLQTTILRIQHLVDKLTKRPQIGKIVHYQQCFPHPMKPNWINRYVRGEWITTTKDGTKSFDNEIDDYFTPTHMVIYAMISGHLNQILKA